MIIGIDGNEANVEKKVGISEFAYRIITEFHKKKDIRFEIYLKSAPNSEMPAESSNWKYRVFGPKKFWTQFALPLTLFKTSQKPDVFFSPTHYAPRFSPVPCVIAVMDISYVFYPETFKKRDLKKLNSWTGYSVKKAKKVITISQSSKNDIINHYKVPESKVVVAYPGIKSLMKTNKKLDLTSWGIKEKYILFVSTLQPRKNIERLIEAFSRLRKDNLQLVIVGKRGWLYEDILAAPKKFGAEKDIVFLDFVSDEELPVLYENAQCLVMPSLYEGFGLPILEAMKYDCPVVASNVSSLPEVGGDAALYFDPYNIDEIKEKIEKVLTDAKLRKRMVEKGREQVKKFSWEKSAEKVLAVLEEVAGK